MTFSVRSCLTTGVAAVTAVTLATTGSVSEPTRHPTSVPTAEVRVVHDPVRLAAAVQQTAVTSAAPAAALPNLLTDWFRDLVPSASASFPTPEFPPVVVGNSLSSGIKNIYNAVEPWVEWGFEVAAYAVGWIPWVGYLAPQIMMFYNLGERIVRSITFNIADWIGGSVSFLQGLRNVAVDTVNSFILFVNDELSYWLPPLPPIPPIGGGLLSEVQTSALNVAGARTAMEIPAGAGTAVVEETTNEDEPKTPTEPVDETTAPTAPEPVEPVTPDTSETPLLETETPDESLPEIPAEVPNGTDLEDEVEPSIVDSTDQEEDLKDDGLTQDGLDNEAEPGEAVKDRTPVGAGSDAEKPDTDTEPSVKNDQGAEG